MRTPLASFFTPLLFLAIPGGVLAQSSPYAGTWTGTATTHTTYTCTCSGSPSCPPPNPGSCDAVVPLGGTIDSQGSVKFQASAGALNCVDSFGTRYTQPIGGYPLGGRVSSSGVMPVGSSTPPGGSCPAFNVTFSLSPASFSGQQQCTNGVTSTDPVTGAVFNCPGSYTDTFAGTRAAAAPFPMTVTSNINATSASASAQLQPRPQDAGKSASVFVFVHAPASEVQGAKRAQLPGGAPIRLQDGGDPCVLAQVDPSGKLVAASASSLASAFTGVLNSQGQSITLLNNVPTPNVAGATVFAGYGSDAPSMLANGVYQGAVTVPGTVSCGTTLLSAEAPQSPAALSGLWYDAAESGWGIYFAQRRNILFAAWYTYDGSGSPKWYVASSCAMPSGATGTSGACDGALLQVNGPAFFGAPFDASRIHAVNAGTLHVEFTDADHASMTYTVSGQTRTIPIARQVFQSSAVPPAVDFTDLWYNASESGWGMAMSHQFGIIFLAWFVYDANGNPVWYVASSCTVSGNSCSGALYRTTGPAFGPSFDSTAVHAFQVGTVTVTFSDPNHALLSYTVDGTPGTKSITRQVF